MRTRLGAVLVGGLLLGTAQTAQAATPQQAVVFDGSGAASDTFVVALSALGVQLDLGAGGFVCPGASHTSPGGVAMQVELGAGVFPAPSGLWQCIQLTSSQARARALTEPLSGSFHAASRGASAGSGAPSR